MTDDPIKNAFPPGKLADGSIDIFDESELAARRVQRDADEAAFDALDETSYLDDVEALEDDDGTESDDGEFSDLQQE